MHVSFSNPICIQCESRFYSCKDIIGKEQEFTFLPGTNHLMGDIDSGIFAISYILSVPNQSNAYERTVLVDDGGKKLSDVQKQSGYVDESYMLFSKRKSVKQMILSGLKKSGCSVSFEEIVTIFGLSNDRLNRPLKQCGNEGLRAMVAILFSYEKNIFCFPWLSKNRYESQHSHYVKICDILSSFGKTVIIPTARDVVSKPSTLNLTTCYADAVDDIVVNHYS